MIRHVIRTELKVVQFPLPVSFVTIEIKLAMILNGLVKCVVGCEYLEQSGVKAKPFNWARLLALSYPPRPSAWHNSNPTDRVFMKFYIWVFMEEKKTLLGKIAGFTKIYKK